MCCQLVIGTSKTTTVGTGRDLSVTRQLPIGSTYVGIGRDLSVTRQLPIGCTYGYSNSFFGGKKLLPLTTF